MKTRKIIESVNDKGPTVTTTDRHKQPTLRGDRLRLRVYIGRPVRLKVVRKHREDKTNKGLCEVKVQ